jgi:hypothetical protein
MLNTPTAFIQSDAADARLRILLAEYDAAISLMLAQTLTESRLAAYAANSGPEMGRILQRDEINVIAVEVLLPGEDDLSVRDDGRQQRRDDRRRFPAQSGDQLDRGDRPFHRLGRRFGVHQSGNDDAAGCLRQLRLRPDAAEALRDGPR